MPAKVILIVEDELSILENLSDVVGYSGYLPLVARNTIEALNLVETFEIDLILCDIKLPGNSGLYFARQLRQIGINIPVVFQTAWVESVALLEAKEYGKVLIKPYELSELITLIKEVLADATE
jgi:CheY-like chemotaxis protein